MILIHKNLNNILNAARLTRKEYTFSVLTNRIPEQYSECSYITMIDIK